MATRGPNQGDTSLQNIAAASIGAPLLLFNPATSTIATGPIAHAIEVAMNPLAAETMLGAFLGTGAQAAGIAAGIYNASNTIDKWLNGNFDLYDIPYFALDVASTIPVFNTVTGLADDAVRMTQNAYRTQRAARNATKPMTHGDPGLAQDYINAAGNAEGISVPTVKPPYTQTDVDKVRQALNFNDVPNVENSFGDSALEILNKVKRGNYVNEFDASRIPKNPGYHPLQYPYLPDKVFDKLGIDSYKLKPTYMKEFVSTLDDIPADEMLSVIRPQSTRHFNYD